MYFYIKANLPMEIISKIITSTCPSILQPRVQKILHTRGLSVYTSITYDQTVGGATNVVLFVHMDNAIKIFDAYMTFLFRYVTLLI